MVEFPTYMRLVVSRTQREQSPSRMSRSKQAQSASTSDGSDTVTLVSKENRLAASNDIPTSLEAEQALRRLQNDLPQLTSEQAGEIHSNMDRRVILSLLAPLVES